jgi:hypothetical protein
VTNLTKHPLKPRRQNKGRKPADRHLHRGVSYSAKDRQWVITDEYISGYVILARFDTSAEALDALKEMMS